MLRTTADPQNGETRWQGAGAILGCHCCPPWRPRLRGVPCVGPGTQQVFNSCVLPAVHSSEPWPVTLWGSTPLGWLGFFPFYLFIYLFTTGFIFILFIDFRGRERGWEKERKTSICCSIHAFISCLLYVLQPGIEPATLAYLDNAPTNRTTRPG